MNKISLCPNCRVLQSRWDFYEPVPGFINHCKHCGTHFKCGKLKNIIDFTLGGLVATLLIFAYKEITPLTSSVAGAMLLLLALLYLNPFYTKLFEVQNVDGNLMKKWMIPLVKWQAFIIAYLGFVLGTNLFVLIYLSEHKEKICCATEKIEKITSIEKLKEIAIWESDMLQALVEFKTTMLDANIMLASVSILLLSCHSILKLAGLEFVIIRFVGLPKPV